VDIQNILRVIAFEADLCTCAGRLFNGEAEHSVQLFPSALVVFSIGNNNGFSPSFTTTIFKFNPNSVSFKQVSKRLERL